MQSFASAVGTGANVWVFNWISGLLILFRVVLCTASLLYCILPSSPLECQTSTRLRITKDSPVHASSLLMRHSAILTGGATNISAEAAADYELQFCARAQDPCRTQLGQNPGLPGSPTVFGLHVLSCMANDASKIGGTLRVDSEHG